MPARKLCTTCQQAKPLAAFGRDRSRRDGLDRRCKTCEAARKFGTPKPRTGTCPICLEDKPLVVDHDHTTLVVRGLLCVNCNAGLGQFRDNSEAMLRALEYLRDAAAREPQPDQQLELLGGNP